MKQVVSAGVVVYRTSSDDREYLLLQYAAGHWDFAKGKMEQGETKHATALRELHEEAGMSATLLPDFEYSFDYLFVDYDGREARKTVYFFVGLAQPGDVVLSHEHTNFVWLPYEQALGRLTYNNAQQLLQEVEYFLVERDTLLK